MIRAALAIVAACILPVTAAVSLSDLVVPGATCEKVAGGFQFVEGPAWSPRGYLLFSDIPDSRIVMLSVNDKPLSFLQPSGRANGLLFDAAGNLYACQGGARQVARVSLDGKLTPLATSYDGKSGPDHGVFSRVEEASSLFKNQETSVDFYLLP